MVGRRRTWFLLLACGAAALAAAGLVVAYVQRNDFDTWAAQVLLVLSTLVGLGATAWYVRVERQLGGLIAPTAAETEIESDPSALPTPAWWWAVAVIGVVDVLGGAAVSGWLALVGVLLVGLALVALGRAERQPRGPLNRSVVRGARRLHDRPAPRTGSVEAVGHGKVRIVVAGDGSWDDVVVRDVPRAELVAALAGIEVSKPTDPSWATSIGRGPAAWSPMSGPTRR